MLAKVEATGPARPATAVRRLRRLVLPHPSGLVDRLVYALLGLPLGAVYAGLFAGLVAGAVLTVYGVGLAIALAVLMLTRGLGGWERQLSRRFLGSQVEDCVALRRQGGGAVRLIRALLMTNSTWRTLAWLGVRVLFAGAVFATLFFAAGLAFLLLTYPDSMNVARSLSMDLLVIALTGLTGLVAVRALDLQAGFMGLVAPRLLDVSSEARLAALRRASVRMAGRTTVARDLHDTIGHTLTASLLQASAAGKALDPSRPPDLDFARQALSHIEENTRQALVELDRALAMLGDPGLPSSEPDSEPDLTDAEGLLAGLAEAGLPVMVRIDVDAGDLPPAVSRFAYRVVQEGTTNVLRHAGPVPTLVEVTRVRRRLVVRVRNEAGSLGATRPGPGGGRGLGGLQGRAAELGGTVTAEPTRDGGFEVAATLRTSLRTSLRSSVRPGSRRD